MNKSIKIISSLAVLLSLLTICFLRTVPTGKLWDEYSVLYVPESSNDNDVLSAFYEAGINDVVSLSQQYLPLNLSEESIEYAMYKVNINSNENKYIKDRNHYFFDQSNNYRLYYVPRNYDHKINKVISILQNNSIPSGLDANAGYPVLFPIVVTIFTFIISFFSREKWLFLITSIIPVLYVFCNPFFPVAISISLLILCIFFISNIWKRKGSFNYLSKFIFIPICLVTALLCGFASSLRSGFMFVVAMIGVVGVFITYYWVEDYFINKKSFIPVNIRPAKMVSIINSKTKTVFFIAFISLILMLISFILSNSGIVSNISSKISLPAESSIPSKELPQLDDYYDWVWNVTTYPYKSLNSNDNNKSIIYPVYNDNNGLISVTNKVMTYDNVFQNEIFDNINNLQFNSIEQVMKSQGEDFTGGYNSTSSYHIDLFGIIMIIICYLIFLFINFSIIITRKGTRK